MAEEIKAAPVVDTKAAAAPVVDAAKAAPAAAPVADNKAAPVTDGKAEAKPVETAAAELKTLLDEAGVEAPKVGEDGKPIAEAKVVPEKYEFTLPEGLVIDEGVLKSATDTFKELGLDQAEAQRIVDLQLQLNKQNEEQHVQAFDQYVEDLKTESRLFFGVKLPEVMKNVARARDQFVHKELQEKLNISGLANDKDVLMMLDKLGRVVGEGKFLEGKMAGHPKPEEAGGGVPLTEVYPSMSKK